MLKKLSYCSLVKNIAPDKEGVLIKYDIKLRERWSATQEKTGKKNS